MQKPEANVMSFHGLLLLQCELCMIAEFFYFYVCVRAHVF